MCACVCVHACVYVCVCARARVRACLYVPVSAEDTEARHTVARRVEVARRQENTQIRSDHDSPEVSCWYRRPASHLFNTAAVDTASDTGTVLPK